ncbi:unnamed protein product [Cunninghamella blakesleeana]
MPNAKKKKAAQNEDFKKKKLKVGKAKALPDNYTNTSFTTKSISLPNQSINENKSSELTTSRNLTLTDLLIQLKHYNSSVKKDALSGLQELCDRNPNLLVSSLGTIVNGIVRLFIDDDFEVRKALLKFLNESFINIDVKELEPFVPLLIIYTCSAMTHIMEDIRLDAIKLLDIWITILPDEIVNKFWKRICGNFSSLLTVDSNNISKSNTTSKITSAASVKAAESKTHLHINKTKLGLLTSLTKFLEAGLFEHRKDYFWFMYTFMNDRHARKSFKRKFDTENNDTSQLLWNSVNTIYTPHHIMTPALIPYLSADALSFSPLHLFESASGDISQNKNNRLEVGNFSFEDRVGQVKELIEQYQPLLIGNWLESAPVVFTSSTTISYTPALQMLHNVLHLSLILWRAMISSGAIKNTTPQWTDSYLQQLLKHCCAYFPFGISLVGNCGAKVESTLQEMSIMTCELTSLYLLARKIQYQEQVSQGDIKTDLKNNQHSKKQIEAIEELPPWAERFVDYVLGLLGYEEADNKMSSDFKNENLINLLPAIWGFLNCLDGDQCYSLFKAIIGYYKFCHAHSATKRTMLAFIIRIYLIQSIPSYNGRFKLLPNTKYANLMKEWLITLPRVLWELKTAHLNTTKLILNAMCDIAKRDDKDIFDTATLRKTELSLVPYFYVHIASKGDIYGPFLHLPKELQKRTVEFLYFVNSDSEKIKLALSKCQSHELMTDEILNWIK